MVVVHNLNENLKQVVELNARIANAKESIADNTEELADTEQEFVEIFDEIANGRAEESEIAVIRDKISYLKTEIENENSLLDALERSKEGRKKSVEADIKQANADAFEELQEEYDKIYNEAYLPARTAFVKALDELGAIQRNASRLNQNVRYYLSEAGVTEHIEINGREKLSVPAFVRNSYTGRDGVGVSEDEQRNIANGKGIPLHLISK